MYWFCNARAATFSIALICVLMHAALLQQKIANEIASACVALWVWRHMFYGQWINTCGCRGEYGYFFIASWCMWSVTCFQAVSWNRIRFTSSLRSCDLIDLYNSWWLVSQRTSRFLLSRLRIDPRHDMKCHSITTITGKGKGTWIYIAPWMTSISSSRRSDMDHTV